MDSNAQKLYEIILDIASTNNGEHPLVIFCNTLSTVIEKIGSLQDNEQQRNYFNRMSNRAKNLWKEST